MLTGSRDLKMVRKCLFSVLNYSIRFFYATKPASKLIGEMFKSGYIVRKLDLNEVLSNLAIEHKPDMFDVLLNIKLGKGAGIQITNSLLTQGKKGEDGLGYYNKGKRFNCQRIDGFKAANYFYKKFI